MPEWRGTIVRSCSECDDMDTNERTVLFGLTTIITVCGAVLLWVHRQSAAPMNFIERHLGFSARQWRRFNGTNTHCGSSHDRHRLGIPLGV